MQKKKLFYYGLIPLLIGIVIVVVIGARSRQPFHLTILHTNDVHGYYEPDEHGNGGAALAATLIRQARQEDPDLLLLDAGDQIEGTQYFGFYRGEASAKIMNALNYDVFGIGNHEFDHGVQIVAGFIDALEMPTVSANLELQDVPELAGKIAPYVIVERKGQKIGVIGIMTIYLDYFSYLPEELGVNPDLVGVVQAQVDELEARGIDKIILLSHAESTDEVVAQISGVDVVIEGHSHHLYSNTVPDAKGPYPLVLEGSDGNPVLLVQTGYALKYLGHLEVTFDHDGVLTEWSGDSIPLTSDIEPDKEMKALMNALIGPMREYGKTVVGQVGDTFSYDLQECTTGECAAGNVFADALRSETGVQIALLTNEGMDSGEADAGDIEYRDLFKIISTENYAVTFEMNGAELLVALNDPPFGTLWQVSGLRYHYDPKQEIGSRVTDVEILDDASGAYLPLDAEDNYTVACNSYLTDGTSRCGALAKNALEYNNTNRQLVVIVGEYIGAHSPVPVEVEGRITVSE